MEFARKTLGVDVLQFEETRTVSGERAAAVRAGKYLTRDIYVGVKQGATSDSSSVGVEVEVTPNVYIDSGGFTFRQRHPFVQAQKYLQAAVETVGAEKISWEDTSKPMDANCNTLLKSMAVSKN